MHLVKFILAIVSALIVNIIGLIIAENLITATHWVMLWGYFVIQISLELYKFIMNC